MWCVLSTVVHWPEVFDVSNRHRHRGNMLQSGLRSSDTPGNMSLSLLQWSEVYDIGRDGSVSSVWALAGEIVTHILYLDHLLSTCMQCLLHNVNY